MSDTDNPTTAAGPAPFGVRLDAATLARLDAYAARIDHKRGGAAVRAIVAGLDALEGVPAPLPSPGSPAPSAGLDVEALAAALCERVGPMLAAAVTEGAHRARCSDLAPVGVVGAARVVDGPTEIQPRGVVTRLPADALRNVQGERRKEAPDRRDPPPREEPGRRLADALKAARDARGTEGRPMPQRAAAVAAGVPPATYQRAEQGKDVKPGTRRALEAWIAG